jgi:hypothetical protein
MADRISMGARREVLAAVADRYRSAGRQEKGRILDELTATTGWHRKHAVRALSGCVGKTAAGEQASATEVNTSEATPKRNRRRKYDGVRDALVALWEASDRVCGKRLEVMIPVLLPALERHGRLTLGKNERALILSVSAATIDRMLMDVKIAAAGGRRRRVGFYSAIRREVPIRTFNEWSDPPPGYCEIDMVAHGGTSVAGSFIQTLTMVDIATGWTECLPLVARDGSFVVEAMTRAQSLFPWLLRGADFDNDCAFMSDVVVPWLPHTDEVTRSRAYKKNDQAFVEQKNGAVVRRLVGYGRFDGVETARVMARLYAAARLHVNFFQPSFKLKERRREGAKVIKRYHAPATPYARALAHPKLSKVIKAGCARHTTVSIRWCCSPRSARRRTTSASASASAVLPRRSAHRRQIHSPSPNRSARRPKSVRCARRIASANGVTRSGCSCPPSSIRIWRRSRTGWRRSLS